MAAPLISGALSTVGSLFGNWQQGRISEAQAEAEAERARQAAIAAATRRKTDYLPLIIIGSVVLIGGVVVISSIKK